MSYSSSGLVQSPISWNWAKIQTHDFVSTRFTDPILMKLVLEGLVRPNLIHIVLEPDWKRLLSIILRDKIGNNRYG